jgi:hypothetical protein
MGLIGKAGFYHRTCTDVQELLFGKSLESIGYAGWSGVRASAVVVELLLMDQYILSCLLYWVADLLSFF